MKDPDHFIENSRNIIVTRSFNEYMFPHGYPNQIVFIGSVQYFTSPKCLKKKGFEVFYRSNCEPTFFTSTLENRQERERKYVGLTSFLKWFIFDEFS